MGVRMATVAKPLADPGLPEQKSNPIAHAIDRWIYVFMAAWFIAITLVGFVPFTIDRIAANRAGTKPPFPPILHVHAVVMSLFLLLLLTQAILIANGRIRRHQWLGRAAFVLVPLIVVVMILLVRTTYDVGLSFAQTAPPHIREKLLKGLTHDNTLLFEIREIVLFPIFMFIALKARRNDPDLHKRMMFLSTAVILLAATNRIPWLPKLTRPPLSADLYVLLILSPMFIWDVIRLRRVPKAYLIWGSVSALCSIPVYMLWGTPWWFATVPDLMRL